MIKVHLRLFCDFPGCDAWVALLVDLRRCQVAPDGRHIEAPAGSCETVGWERKCGDHQYDYDGELSGNEPDEHYCPMHKKKG